MRTTQQLAVAALASLVVAQQKQDAGSVDLGDLENIDLNDIDLGDMNVDGLDIDIDREDLDKCGSAYMELLPSITDIPIPNPTLAAFIIDQSSQLGTLTDPCMIPQVTGDLADEYSSFASEMSSWYGAKKPVFSSLLDACPAPDSLENDFAVCTELKWQSEGGITASTTASGSPSESATSTITTPSMTVTTSASPTATDDSSDDGDDEDSNNGDSDNSDENGDSDSMGTSREAGIVMAAFAAFGAAFALV